MKYAGLIVVAAVAALLLHAVEDFPAWGDAHSPANAGRVSHRYITHTPEETAVPNLVTAVLADYRGYDTMFETAVIFTAGIAILAVLGLPLRRKRRNEVRARRERSARDPKGDIIVRTACRVVVPVVQLFALYVIAHGHHSPGGGFQGGVILGASLIIVALAYDLPTASRRLPLQTAVVLGALGVLIYAGIGVACMALGGNFLDYGQLAKVLPVDPVYARYHSMLGVEIGVALTVMAVIFFIYGILSSGGDMKEGL